MSTPGIELLTEHQQAATGHGMRDAGGGAPRLRLATIPAHEPPLDEPGGRSRLCRPAHRNWRCRCASHRRHRITIRFSDHRSPTGRICPIPDPGHSDFSRLSWNHWPDAAARPSCSTGRAGGVYRDIVRVAHSAGHKRSGVLRGEGVNISRIRVCEPADGVAEVCAVARRDGRWHAVAARLEGIDGRWRCVSLTVG